MCERKQNALTIPVTALQDVELFVRASKALVKEGIGVSIGELQNTRDG